LRAGRSQEILAPRREKCGLHLGHCYERPVLQLPALPAQSRSEKICCNHLLPARVHLFMPESIARFKMELCQRRICSIAPASAAQPKDRRKTGPPCPPPTAVALFVDYEKIPDSSAAAPDWAKPDSDRAEQ